MLFIYTCPTKVHQILELAACVKYTVHIFHEPILFMEFVNWSKLFKTSASYYNSRMLKKPLRATIIAAC